MNPTQLLRYKIDVSVKEGLNVNLHKLQARTL